MLSDSLFLQRELFGETDQSNGLETFFVTDEVTLQTFYNN